ncbi:hypothetical protein ACHAWF_004531 [Thalassiosira exigua]
MATENAPTELVHLTYDGNFQLDTEATVLHCRVIDVGPGGGDDGEGKEEGQRTVPVELLLDVTTMHPQGGGQPTDVGTVAVRAEENSGEGAYSADIRKVTIDRSTGLVTHAGVACAPSGSSPESDPFPPGARVTVRVDPANRLLLSECHTAGHVVDAAMARCDKLLPPTKGYHFLDGPYVEYKGAIDVKERDEFLERLKVAYQELIDEDITTNIQTLSVDEADELCNRLAQNFDVKDFTSPTDPNPSVRVVTVAGWNCPCGGTHVRSTGALKARGWRVKGLRCKKGVVRVRYGYGEGK